VRYRRADLAWALLLVLSAGMSLSEMLFIGRPWVPLLMIVLAYPAGRRMGSFSLALWVFAAVACTGLILADPLSEWLTLVQAEFVSLLSWWFGRYQRLRAEQRERERGIVADQARLRERARIAQDMHDSLGHELALIALRGGALELAPDLTDEQRLAASELRAGAVRATDRLHEIVRVLGTSDAAAALQPAGESIDDLVRRAASAGLRVRLEGAVPAWSPMIGQAAHRVVQESLTNAARHAPGASVTVTVAREDGGTRIDVVNEAMAQPGSGAGTGQGLIGLDERVRLVGGRLDAGPRPDGGWAVTAVLPDGATPRDNGPTGFELRVSKRLSRRRQLQTAALPIGVGFALVVTILLVELFTLSRTGLPRDRYEELRVGQSWDRIEPLLPARDIGDPPRVLAAPAPPAGAKCVYYQAGNTIADLDSMVYRLCHAGGVLVSKNLLERA
jgi:signal transduction histidine kinase